MKKVRLLLSCFILLVVCIATRADVLISDKSLIIDSSFETEGQPILYDIFLENKDLVCDHRAEPIAGQIVEFCNGNMNFPVTSNNVSDPIYYEHPQLHIIFEINTATKEAILGPRYDGNRDNCLEIPNSLKYANINEWIEECNRRTLIWQNMEIPSTITYKNESYIVSSVASYAFYRAEEIKTIKLPETIKSIGESAFSWCVNLNSINIPTDITEIASSTFYFCRELEQVTLPPGVQEIGGSAFCECWKLKKINIPGSCTKIGNEAFSWCQNLSTIILEDGEQPVECGYSYGLSIDYQGSHQPQFRGIFADAPADTVYIGRSQFVCPKTKNRELRPFLSISNYANNASGGYTGYTGKNFDEVLFGDKVTIIQDSLFWASSIENIVVLPDGLIEIGDYSFYADWGCFSQDSLVIPNSVNYIGARAFEGCAIDELRLYGACEQWGIGPFNKCKIQRLIIGPSVRSVKPIGTNNNISYIESLPLTPPASANLFGATPIIVSPGAGSLYREQWDDAIIIDDSDEVVSINVKTPGSLYSRLLAQDYQLDKVYKLKLKGELNEEDLSVLSSMTKLYSYDMSELNMPELPQGLFQGMRKLLDVCLPNNLIMIRDNEFMDCINLKETICIPATCTSIGEYAFANTQIDTLLCLGGVNIGEKAFSGCSNLSNVEFRDTTILNYFVFESANIYEVEIPQGSILKSYSFHGSGLKSIIFANGVESIEDNALGNDISCITFNGIINKIGHQEFPNLKRINAKDISVWCQLPFSDTEIMSKSPLLYIDNQLVEHITLPESIKIRDNAFYNCKTLISASIPNEVSVIPAGIFYGCSNLSHVDLPSSVKQISSEAFSGCISLTSISLPNTIECIGDNAFSSCTKLQVVEFPKYLKQIGKYAFYNCSSLKEIRFPASISSIGEHAFAYCSSIEEIRAQWQEPIVINKNTFDGVHENCILYVPIMTASKYYVSGWEVKNVKEAGVLKITVQGGGELVFEEKSIRNKSEEILFTPYKSFYLTFNSDDDYSIRKLRLNGENVITMVEDGKIYIEEPEENIELAVTFGDNSVKNGDVNGNGFIEKEDAVLLMRHIVNDKSEPIFEYASDMNDDDVINVTDVLLIIKETNK